jgi:hypothetical protein
MSFESLFLSSVVDLGTFNSSFLLNLFEELYKICYFFAVLKVNFCSIPPPPLLLFYQHDCRR